MGLHHPNSMGQTKAWEDITHTKHATRGSHSSQFREPRQSVGGHRPNLRGHTEAWELVHHPNFKGHNKGWESITPTRGATSKTITPNRGAISKLGRHSPEMERARKSVGVGGYLDFFQAVLGDLLDILRRNRLGEILACGGCGAPYIRAVVP